MKYPDCIWTDEDISPCYKCSLTHYGLDCHNIHFDEADSVETFRLRDTTVCGIPCVIAENQYDDSWLLINVTASAVDEPRGFIKENSEQCLELTDYARGIFERGVDD